MAAGKDRAAPFSRKHRRYWLPVTGGMLLIGAINVALGLCSYHDPVAPQPIRVDLPSNDRDLGAIPTQVMRAFTTRYPRTLPTSFEARGDGTYVLVSPRGRATFRADGTFVSEAP